MKSQPEKRRKLDASISNQPGADQMEHEKTSDLEEKISELEKKLRQKENQEKKYVAKNSKLENSLKDAKHKSDVYRFELGALHEKHRKATEVLEAVEKAFLEGLDGGPRGDHGRIGPKEMGFFDTQDEWYCLFEDTDDLKVDDKFMTFWEARVKDPDFDASMFVDDGKGNMKYIIREDHEELNQLRKSYGDAVYEAVCNLHLGVVEWGADESVLWDYMEDRKASIMDVLEGCYLDIQSKL